MAQRTKRPIVSEYLDDRQLGLNLFGRFPKSQLARDFIFVDKAPAGLEIYESWNDYLVVGISTEKGLGVVLSAYFGDLGVVARAAKSFLKF